MHPGTRTLIDLLDCWLYNTKEYHGGSWQLAHVHEMKQKLILGEPFEKQEIRDLEDLVLDIYFNQQ